MFKVAVVGHGPSLLNSKCGGVIDAADIVIRMADSTWQNFTDYGIKTDIYCGTIIKGQLKKYWFDLKKPPKMFSWIWCKRKDPYNNYALSTQLPKFKIDFVQDSIDAWQMMYAKFLNSSYPFMTRGTAAILLALEKLEPDTVHVFGCDNLAKGINEGFCDHKSGFKNTTQKHNYSLELRIIKAAEQLLKVPVIFWR